MIITEIDKSEIKVFKLSYKKVQIEYMVPVYLCDISETIYTPIDSALLELRCRRQRDQFIIEQDMLKEKLTCLQKTIDDTERATVKYQYNTSVSDNKRTIVLSQIPKCILVKTKSYTLVSREMKLQSLL